MLPVVVFAVQLISAQQSALTARLIRTSRAHDAVIVLDLEDALWEVGDDARTAELKRAGRANLVQLAAEHAELWAGQRIGVRVNRLGYGESTADLSTLGAISRAGFRFECVVPTKVESGAELARWAGELAAHDVDYGSLVPIVETVAGIANLVDICATARIGQRPDHLRAL